LRTAPLLDRWYKQQPYRWRVTLTHANPELPGTTIEETRTVVHPDELCDIVLRTSYDPNIVAYTYHRYAVPIDTCPECGEAYVETPPTRQWYPCACGGHLIRECVACGEQQAEPPLHH
jgi:hypothetical protein